MKYPPFLSPGDKVSIISPAGRIEQKVVERAAELLRQQGFIVEIGQHAFDGNNIFAGSDLSRSADMQKAINDKSVKAIFFSRGGYGCLRTHNLLNWSSFFKKPKWLIGFSDITVFHAYLSRHNIASVHGVMTSMFEKDELITSSFLQLIELLKGKVPEYSVATHELNRKGNVSGILTGGNLSIIQSLRGTLLDISPKGKILFIEDIGEHHYHLDRMMQNLKAGHILEQISGLVVGYFTGIKDEEPAYGQTACEIIKEAVAQYKYPVVFNFPSGHQLPNYPILLGSRISLKVSDENVIIKTL